MGAETILPFRSLKTNCGLNSRFSVLAAEAESAAPKTKTRANRRIVFRMKPPPMHLIGRVRKRFFRNFFIIKQEKSSTRLSIQQLVVRPALKTTHRRGNIWMRFCPGEGLGRVLSRLVWVAALSLTACAAVNRPAPGAQPSGRLATVYLVHHGSLHTGLTVKRSDIPTGHWPAS